MDSEWRKMSNHKIETQFLTASLCVAMILLSLCVTACRRHTGLVIENGVPLRFVLSGPGTLHHFVVSGPDLGRELHPQGKGERLMLSKTYWELAPNGTASRTLDEIGPISYGKIPTGFVQVQPSGNLPPPPLVQTHLYNVTFTVNNDQESIAFSKYARGGSSRKGKNEKGDHPGLEEQTGVRPAIFAVLRDTEK